jgi:aspartate aminotransferase-like enzyme/GNAT superfamily N-acetyltransferase
MFMSRFKFKIAEQEAEFEAIHSLNYRTFVEEIPQHPANPERRLVDAFHAENTYAICLDGEQLVGMIAGRGRRPFSLDRKLPDLDGYLPAHGRPVELRLLAVLPEYRQTDVFARLVATLADRYSGEGYDLAVILGTLRQTKLYRHLGFVPFGPRVGSNEAPYQPMYLDLAAFQRVAPRLAMLTVRPTLVNLLPGPVAMAPAVTAAFAAPAISHRSKTFGAMHRAVCRAMSELTGATSVSLLAGSGTLANDAVAAQLSLLPGRGLVVANGEFGERLLDHARCWQLDAVPHRLAWGEPLDLADLARQLDADPGIRWLWAVACETSTGMLNPSAALTQLCAARGIALCLDAVSAVGAMPIRLDGVRFATCVSGKALGAYPGVALVLANGEPAAPGSLPRYLDLALYRDTIPFTQSSNLLAALHAALVGTDWSDKFIRIGRAAQALRQGLRQHGFAIVSDDARSAPAVTTLSLPATIDARKLGRRLARSGFLLACESAYLQSRNWLQACLMGTFDDAALTALPDLLALHAADLGRIDS